MFLVFISLNNLFVCKQHISFNNLQGIVLTITITIGTIILQRCDGYVIIDPTTGRELTSDSHISSMINNNDREPNQNPAGSPGDFVRGRNGNINLYAANADANE